jgi:hypothetical protein
MSKQYQPYSPYQAAAQLRGLRIAAQQVEREEFNRIFVAAIQFILPLDTVPTASETGEAA